MFDRDADNEGERNENDEALLAWRKHKHRQQPLHLFA
jgi:hypothetical protein